MYSDREILYFLQTVGGIGNRSIRHLFSGFRCGMDLFTADEELLGRFLMPAQLNAFLREREKKNPKERMEELRKKEIAYYSIFDWQYPLRLRMIADAPLALFVRGSLPPEEKMTASVIGARYHSFYGNKSAKEYAALLAAQGVGLVSGMAKGIDSIAQMAALENGGKSYAVLGCGVDICYPSESRKLYDRLPSQGGIISEYPPGTEPKAGLFPMRNRIISALGDILLVMEAKEKSGTLITVDMALEQGKEIWALPGRTDDTLSYGCNRLIAQGAGILTGTQDFAKELELMKNKYERRGESMLEQRKKASQKGGNQKTVSSPEVNAGRVDTMKTVDGMKTVDTVKQPVTVKTPDAKEQIIQILSYQPLSVDEIYKIMKESGEHSLTLPGLNELLVDLCVEQKICRTGSGHYVQKPKGSSGPCMTER